ncbi:hypothetical protein GCM10009867_18330 [Pedococcus aerophilus]|uniref:DUF4397 domain-containing protein n=2 Tax=Pedococcus aerophilus TaxID=436356 RepID=A0ABN3UMG1_9MICO
MRRDRRPFARLVVGVLLALGSGAAASAAVAAPAADPLAAPAAAATAAVYLIQGVDATTMSLSVDGKAVGPDAAAAKTVVGPLRLTPGRHVVSAVPDAGGDTVEAAIEVAAGSSTDLVLHRQADATKPPVFTTYPNDLSAVTAGSGRLTVAHTAAVGPADIRVKGKVLFANVANGEELTLTVPAGAYPVDIVPAAANGPVVFGPADVPVAKASLTRVFAIGVAETDSMDAVVQVLPVATRGSGADPDRVDAGTGGQAQSLIAASRAGATPVNAPGMAPGPDLAALAGVLVLGAAAAGVGAARRGRTRAAPR